MLSPHLITISAAIVTHLFGHQSCHCRHRAARSPKAGDSPGEKDDEAASNRGYVAEKHELCHKERSEILMFSLDLGSFESVLTVIIQKYYWMCGTEKEETL